jgi:hypothetical protein
MATLTRVNGLNCTVGTMYPLNSSLHLVQVKSYGGAAVDLRNEDDAVDETVEAIVEETNPLAFFAQNTNGGNLYLITDKSITSEDLQHRIRQIGANTAAVRTGTNTFTYANTAVGPNAKDISATTVSSAASMTLL